MAAHPVPPKDDRPLPHVGEGSLAVRGPIAITRPPADEEASTGDEMAPATPADELIELMEASFRVAVGAAVTAAAVSSGLLRRGLGRETGPRSDDDEQAFASLVVGAALGATAETALLAGRLLRVGWTAARWSGWLIPLPRVRVAARRSAERWNDGWQDAAARSKDAAEAFARELVPVVVDATLDQLDLTPLVRERVDLDAVAASIDLNAVAAGIDLDGIVDRLDLDRIAARIDVDAVVDRVDLERTIGRIDVTAIAREVIEELDLASLIRESTETVTSEAVDDLRLGAVDADRAVARVVDRLMRRHGGRPPAPVPGGDGDRPP